MRKGDEYRYLFNRWSFFVDESIISKNLLFVFNVEVSFVLYMKIFLACYKFWARRKSVSSKIAYAHVISIIIKLRQTCTKKNIIPFKILTRTILFICKQYEANEKYTSNLFNRVIYIISCLLFSHFSFRVKNYISCK